MADVTLAESNDQVWLVDGERHLDDLLANTLATTVTVEIVGCATRAEVWAMWEASPEGPRNGGMPWLIHPGVVRRVKGASGAHRIQFTPWSAMLTNAAQEAVAAAAGWLEANAAGRLTLRQFCLAQSPPGLADLQRLRGQLVAAALSSRGVAADRLDQETNPSEDPLDCERLDLISITTSG